MSALRVNECNDLSSTDLIRLEWEPNPPVGAKDLKTQMSRDWTRARTNTAALRVLANRGCLLNVVPGGNGFAVRSESGE